jgi:hypothetical protein
MDSWNHSEWHVVRLAHLDPTHIGQAACHSEEGGYILELPHFLTKKAIDLAILTKILNTNEICTSVKSKPVSKNPVRVKNVLLMEYTHFLLQAKYQSCIFKL